VHWHNHFAPRLGYLYSECQRIGDWIEHQAAVADGANVVPLRA
jgi:hypothetical protein